MAATDVDEEAWLYGGDYNSEPKVNDRGDVKTRDAERSDSALLDDLDDAIGNIEVKQQVTNRIVSVSNSLLPKAATPSGDTKALDDDAVFELDKEKGGEGEDGDGGQGAKGGEDEEEEDESESDDDDVQIHIGPIETQAAPFYPGRLPSTSNTALTAQKKVDVDAVPTIGGQSLYEIDLDSADKPWRLPGADITDYFNYGFMEETWRLYSEKQRKMKAEVIQLNKIAVHTTRIGTFPKSGTITSIPSIGALTSSFHHPIHHGFPLPPTGLHLPPNLLPPPPLPLHNLPLPPILPEAPHITDQEAGDGGKTPESVKEEGSDGRATPGVDQDGQEAPHPPGKVPLLPVPPGQPRTSTSTGHDVANAMAAAAMLGGLRHPEPPFPSFLPPPGFPPPFLPGEFRPRVPPFHGGPPPPFPLLPGGPLDVPGMLHPLDERGIPIHPELLPGGWDPSMGPPPPELFDMIARREDYSRGSRSPSRSGSSGRSRSRTRSSSYDDRKGSRRRDRRSRRHSRSRSHSRDRDRDRDRDRHGRSSRRHRTNHHRSDRHDRDRDRDRERERERERERRRRDERSRRERSRRHRSSSRDREDDRGSGAGGRSGRDRKTKDSAPRDERSHSRTPT